MQTYWHKQTIDQPLFADLLWSRPENRAQAGKLLIIGGSAQGFAAAGDAYNYATKAGIGRARVVLPDSLQKTIGKVFLNGEYAPSTPIGSFAQLALGEFLAMANWADGVLLAGDLGRNSETAILLEKFITKYEGQLTITKDALDYFMALPGKVLDRPDTLLVLSFAQLQKIAISCGFRQAFTFEIDFLRLIDLLHDFTLEHQANIIVKHLDNIFVAANGEVSSTKLRDDQKIWRLQTGTYASVWWLQNPTQVFQALTTSVLQPE